jgi:hypothetical protein
MMRQHHFSFSCSGNLRMKGPDRPEGGHDVRTARTPKPDEKSSGFCFPELVETWFQKSEGKQETVCCCRSNGFGVLAQVTSGGFIFSV